MEKFIKAKAVKQKSEFNQVVVDKFIRKFNAHIKLNQSDSDNFHMNNGLDNIPTLNQKEFDFARDEAIKSGWELTKYNDNYNTTSYRMKKII